MNIYYKIIIVSKSLINQVYTPEYFNSLKSLWSGFYLTGVCGEVGTLTFTTP